MGTQPVLPRLEQGVNLSVATSASDGSAWAEFPPNQCSQLTIFNQTGTTIEWRTVTSVDDGDVAIDLADGASVTIFGIDRAERVKVRRKDTSTSSVNVKARAEG